MAGDWIKFELTTLDKPEVCQIADLADIDPDAVVGKLMRVWAWFDQQTEDGNAPSVSKKLLDRSVGVTGFCEHMKAVRWMVEADGVISLPHFERHNGKTAKNRLLTAKRVANHKAANAKANAQIVSDALPREEKRREESKEQEHTPIPTKGVAAGFAEFWSAYPLKKAKATAEKAWAKLKPSADLQAAILSAIAAHKLSADWQRDGGQYIPHPTTWLNQRRWEDEVTHARSQRPDQNRPRSAVDEVREAIAAREAAEAAAAAAGQAVAEDGGDLRPALDGEFRRVG